MAKPAPISIPTEAIGSSPRPVDLIERVARGDSEDAKPAPRYEVTLRDTIKWFEAWASGRYGSIIMLYVLPAWASKHSPVWLPNSVLRRSFAPPVAPHTRPFPLRAIRSFELGKNWRWRQGAA
jgi:hypothetical protein